MKTFTVVALSALLGFSSAQKATVVNHCAATIYVQSVPYDGSAAGPLTTLQSGQSFSENFRTTGSTIKIARAKTFTAPLFFGYSFTSQPNYAYYEFSSEWGNPFANQHNTLSPGEGCQSFDCDPGEANCYSTPASKKVYGCPQPVNLTAEICL